MGDAVLLFSRVGFIAQGVAVDDARSRIGEEGEGHVAAMIGGDELRELAALLLRVGADGVDLDLGIDTGELPKRGNLPRAVRSPVAAVENEDHLLPRRLGQADAPAVLIAQRERGRRLPNRWPRYSRRIDRGSNGGEEQRGEEWHRSDNINEVARELQ